LKKSSSAPISFPSFDYEKEIWLRNTYVAGVDEAGRGPLAGPVVAASVILPQHFSNKYYRLTN